MSDTIEASVLDSIAASAITLERLRAVTVERDQATTQLDALEAMITRIGGHLKAEDQEVLARARTVLVARGLRPPLAPQTWVDRQCICPVVALAEGTNATGGRIINTACVLHGR